MRGLLARVQRLAAGARGAIAPPLIQRELIGLLRTRMAFWTLVATTAISSLVPLLVWPSEHEAAARGAQNAGTVLSFFIAQIAVSVLLLPALTAGAIAGEREQDTYEALYSTLISPAGIVLSKALAASGFVVLLLVASAPALFILYLLGGVDFGTILRAYAVTFAALVFATMLGLKASMKSTRTAQAVVRGVRAVLRWNIGLMLVLWLLGVAGAQLLGSSVPPAWFIQVAGLVFSASSPILPLIDEVLVKAGGIGQRTLAMSWEPWTVYVASMAVLSLLAFRGLVRRARTPHPALPRWLERIRERRAAARASRPRRRTHLTWALLRLGEVRSSLPANPVFLKEIRTEFFGRAGFRRGLFWGFLALFGLLALVEGPGAEWNLAMIGWVAAAVVVLLAPGLTATAFSREVEHQNLDFLRGTSLSAGEILHGKFLAGLYGGSGVVAAAAWASAVLLLCAELKDWGFSRGSGSAWVPDGSERLYGWSVLNAVLCFTLVTATAISAFAATLSRRSVTAVLIAYTGVFSLYLGWPVFLGLSMRSSGEEVLFATSPFALLGKCLADTHPRWAESDAPGYLIAFGIVFGILTLALWGLAASRSEARFERDP